MQLEACTISAEQSLHFLLTTEVPALAPTRIRRTSTHWQILVQTRHGHNRYLGSIKMTLLDSFPVE